MTSKEVDAVFIDHVQRTVYQLNEPRTLKGLLNDYHNFLFGLRGEKKVYKTSYINTLISEEFKDQTIFNNRYQKNEGEGAVFWNLHSVLGGCLLKIYCIMLHFK